MMSIQCDHSKIQKNKKQKNKKLTAVTDIKNFRDSYSCKIKLTVSFINR